MNRLSLRVKIIIGLVGIVALIEAALLLVVYNRFSTVIDNELVTTGIAIAGDVAANSAQLIPTDNIFALNRLVKDTLANNPDVRYVIVLDVNNNVLAHSFEQGVPASLLQANSYVSGQRYNLAILETNEGVIRDLAVPVSEGRWGTIRLGLSDARQQGILATTTNLIVIVTIGLLIAAAAGIYLISNTLVIRPLEKLGQAAQAISQGDLSQKAVIMTHDELGMLAETFNQMTARLRDLISSLEQRVADRTKGLANVAEISTIASNIQNKEEMLATVVHLVQRQFGLYHAHVFTYRENTEDLQIVACGYKEGDEHEGTHGTAIIPLDQEQSLVARAGRTRQPVIVNDVRSDPGWLPNPLLPDTAAELAVPLIVGDKLVGVLDVQSDQTGIFTESDADIQMTLGAQVAVAMQNIDSTAAVSKRAAELGTVATISTASATIREAQKMLETVVHLTQRGFGLYHAHVFTYNEATKDLQIRACGYREGDEHEGTHGTSVIPVAQEQSLVARAARTRQAVIVNDVRSDPGWLPNPLLPDTASEMAVPMIVGDQLLGVLDVQSERINAFTEEDASIQTTLASQIATSLQNVRSFTQAQKQAEYETTLNLISQKIQGAITIESAMQTAARELGHALGMKPTLVTLDPAALAGENKGN